MMKQLQAALILVFLSIHAFAVDYTLPADAGSGPFSSCTLSGNTLACSSAPTFANGDTIELQIDLTWTSPSMTFANNMIVNPDGEFNLSIEISGALAVNNSSVIWGQLNATGSISINNNATVYGNAEAGGPMVLRPGVTVTGRCTNNGGFAVAGCVGATEIAYFAFNEASWTNGSATIENLTTSTLTATPTGTASQSTGYVCEGASIPANTTEAIRDYIDTGIDVDDDIGNAGTIAFWVKTNEDWGTGERVLLDASQAGTSGGLKYFELRISGSGQLDFLLEDSNDTGYTATSSFSTGLLPNSDEWAHVAITWDFSSRDVTIHLNGTRNNFNNVFTSSRNIGELDTLVIGDNRSEYYGSVNSANAIFDEVRIYNSVKSETEIEAIAIATSTNCTSSLPPTPFAFFELNEPSNWNGTAGEIIDSTGNITGAFRTGTAQLLSVTEASACLAGEIPLNTNNNKDAIDTSVDIDSQIGVEGTISFWHKSSDTGNTRTLFDADRTNKFFYLEQRSDGRLEFGLEDSSDANQIAYSSSTVNFNTWRFITVSWSLNRNEVSIWIDGVLDQTTSISSNGNTANYNTLYIGDARENNSGATDRSANGQFDDIRIFDEVLTDSDVTYFFGQARICGSVVTPTCFVDDYNRTNLDSDWAVSNRSGSFGDPRIVGNRLRLNDSSGNVSTAATLFRLFPSLGNKIIVEFDYFAYGDPSDGGDGLALVFSDASVVPQPGGYGGSLGYAQKDAVNGFDGGWMGVGFDEYGNFLVPGDGNKSGGFTPRVRETITIRGSGSGTTGYSYITSNGISPGSTIPPVGLVPGIETTTGHRYRVTIDHENGTNAYVSVERDTGSGFIDVISTFDLLIQSGQLGIPEKMYLTLTASTGGAINTHEIDNLEVCANTIEPAYYIDHYELDRDYDQGLTCEALNITARACLNSDCSVEISDPVTTTFAPNNGWEGGNTKTNYTSSDSFAFQQTVVGNYTLDVTDSTPTLRPLSVDPVQCFVSGASQADCNVDFVDTAYRFFNSAASTVSVPNYAMTAGELLSGLALRAIERDEATGQCQVFLSDGSSRSSQIGTTCSNPNTCEGGQQVNWQQGSSVLIANPENQVSGNNFTTANIDFTTNGTAQFNLIAPDIGLQVLTVTTPGFTDVDGNPSGRTITGSVNLNVSPDRLAITSVTNTLGDANDGTSKFAKAGEIFSTTIQALDVNGLPVASFGRTTTLHDINWTNSTINEPSLGAMGQIFGDSIDNSSAIQWQGFDSDGDVNNSLESIQFTTGNGITYGEVGQFNLVAQIDDFMGFGETISSTSTPILTGRFTPSYLCVTQIDSDGDPEFSDGCPTNAVANPDFDFNGSWGTNTFIYQGQGQALTNIQYDVKAYDVSGNELKNYVDSFVSIPSDSSAIAKPTLLSSTGGDVSGTLNWVVSNDSDFDGTIRLTGNVNNLLWDRNLAGYTTADILRTISTFEINASALTDDDDICVKTSDAASCIQTSLDINDRSLYYARANMPNQINAGKRDAYVPITIEYLASFNADGEPIFETQSTDSIMGRSTIQGLNYSTGFCSLLDCTGLANTADNSLEDLTFTWLTIQNGLGIQTINATSDQEGIMETEADIPSWLYWYWDDEDNSGTQNFADLTPKESIILFGEYQGRAPILFIRPGFR